MFKSNVRTVDRIDIEEMQKKLDSQINDLHDAATRTTNSQSRLDALASLVSVDNDGNITIYED